jgi:hypothetical protein
MRTREVSCILSGNRDAGLKQQAWVRVTGQNYDSCAQRSYCTALLTCRGRQFYRKCEGADDEVESLPNGGKWMPLHWGGRFHKCAGG